LRKQITFLDPKWTVQLRFLLGTRFNTLFMDKGARGQMTQGETGKVSILALEIALKERMVDLMTLVKFMEQNVNLFNIHHRLDMLYEASCNKSVKRMGDFNIYYITQTPTEIK
jgi:hypothetical protein